MDVQFPPLKNDLLLRAAKGQKTERAPAWIMRQAGRYLPEFRKVRESHGFFEICRSPELATEITLQPIRRYSGLIDAAIIFSDILVIPQAMGMEVIMNPGPHFPEPLNVPSDVEKLKKVVDVDKELGYVFDALTLTRHKLQGEVPLIGFCGAPWTLFGYMIEGGGTKSYQKAKSWLFRYPAESHQLLRRIADICVDFLVGQVKAGAQLLQVFDSSAGELTPYHFREFSYPTLQLISTQVRTRLKDLNLPVVPMTLFARGAMQDLSLLAQTSGYDVLGIDWHIDAAEASRIVGGKTALQGNMDPDVLLAGGRETIESTVKRLCEEFRASKGWIANLGHGITPGVDPEDVKWFFECLQKYSSDTA